MRKVAVFALALAAMSGSEVALARGATVPDLSGTYDIATLTPLRRPPAYGNNLYLTPEEAARIEAEEKARMDEGAQASDPSRSAPPEGGDGSEGAAGNVGGYNTFWIDRGTSAALVDGKFRTSIISSPDNGQQPPPTPEGQKRFAKFFAQFRQNRGDAWWYPGPGPYDNPESLTLSDRCLLGFSSTGGPPMLPALYNNLHRIVQTEDTVMILVEMVHDARIIRLNAEHAPDDMRFWLGDSVGHWEGDTLVVDTTNFRDQPALYGASRNLHVVERFSRNDDGSLLYSFTVDDPTIWTAPWSGEYPWPLTDDRVFEYACHEGNYAMEGILKGARILEADRAAAP
ncbi:MAG: hypothetical protein H6993_07820 [Pseudomonadales bacterium]|nr:hypothetical protein [Pseudomonadales bacterium]MCP5183855.1 hypothetical protein [Pseudomonadales bacterium]